MDQDSKQDPDWSYMHSDDSDSDVEIIKAVAKKNAKKVWRRLLCLTVILILLLM